MDKNKKKNLFIGILIIFVIIDTVLFYFAFLKKDKIETKVYENEYLTFEYISDYIIKEIDSKNISLGKDEKSGQIDIVITELSDEILKRDTGFIIYEATEKFITENADYYQNYYGTYETTNYVVNDFLYDADNGNQVDMNYIISGNKLVLISYANTNQYFDLYEPIVLEIINSLKIS